MLTEPLTDAEIAELRRLDRDATPPGRPTWSTVEIGGRTTLPALFAENATLAGSARNALARLLDEVVERRARAGDHLAVMEIAHQAATVMRAWVGRAIALLKRIEWGRLDTDQRGYCPECGAWSQNRTHKPGCELAALLRTNEKPAPVAGSGP